MPLFRALGFAPAVREACSLRLAEVELGMEVILRLYQEHQRLSLSRCHWSWSATRPPWCSRRRRRTSSSYTLSSSDEECSDSDVEAAAASRASGLYDRTLASCVLANGGGEGCIHGGNCGVKSIQRARALVHGCERLKASTSSSAHVDPPGVVRPRAGPGLSATAHVVPNARGHH